MTGPTVCAISFCAQARLRQAGSGQARAIDMFRTTHTIHVLGDSTAQVAQSPFTLPRINPQGHAATTTPQAKQGLYNAPALIHTYATPRHGVEV